MRNRIQALKAALGRLDGYIVAGSNNILYFTGFLGGARLLVPKDSKSVLYVHGVNYEEAKVTAKDCLVELVKNGEDVDQRVAGQIMNLKTRHVGFDVLDTCVYLKLKKALKRFKLNAESKRVWDLRKVKDESELKCVRKAARLTDLAMKVAIECMKPGLREYELAAEIEYAMRIRGSGGIAFDTIVASGIRSAFPHGGCADRRIQKGDLVVLDFGATYKHYRADMTRTLVVGKPSAKQVGIHEIVKEAQARAFQVIRAEIKASDADFAARKLIEKGGYGQYFVHGLGHGVGLEVHEPPYLSPKSKDVLNNGNVVTVEPGIYVAGFGGIRIEDTVLVCKEKAEKLTKSPYSLKVG